MKTAKRTLIIIVGIFFILLGLVGLVLPFLQGILFIFLGLFLLSFYSPKTRLLIEKYASKSPRLFSAVKKIEDWMKKILGEI